jgi:hypothetical protein
MLALARLGILLPATLVMLPPESAHAQISGPYAASMSTEPVTFHLSGQPYHVPPKNTDCCKPIEAPDYSSEAHLVRYRIPRNYLIAVNGSLLVVFKITYPGFKPLTKGTEACLSQAPADRPVGCTPVQFFLRAGGAYDVPDEIAFQNARNFSRGPTPKMGPAGFELYEAGPEEARINTYRIDTKMHTLMIQCFRNNDEPVGVCNTSSRLPTGNVLEYHLNEDQLKDAVAIDTGIRQLIAKFVQ